MEVQGISLVARAVLIARKLKEIRWIIVSTDDKDIASEAERAGATVPFMRPAHLSKGDTPMLAVLEHAFQWFKSSMPEEVPECQGLLLLQPTSPMRRKEHVLGAIDLYMNHRRKGIRIAGVHAVSPVPLKWAPWNLWRFMNRGTRTGINKSTASRMVINGEVAGKGQLYYRNGAAIVLDPGQLNALTLAAGPVIPYIINKPLVTIDTLYDLLYIEHCGGRLEPDPLEIGWKSLQNKAGYE